MGTIDGPPLLFCAAFLDDSLLASQENGYHDGGRFLSLQKMAMLPHQLAFSPQTLSMLPRLEGIKAFRFFDVGEAICGLAVLQAGKVVQQPNPSRPVSGGGPSPYACYQR